MTLPPLCVYAALTLPGVAVIPAAVAPPALPGPARSLSPNMTRIPKSYLISGLLSLRGQTYFTGPNGGIVMGPMHIRDFSVRPAAPHRR